MVTSRGANNRRRPNHRPLTWALLVAVVSLVVAAACTSEPSEEVTDVVPAVPDPDTEEPDTEDPDTEATGDTSRGRTDFKPTITIGVTSWTGARVNVSIAEQLIELNLGYPVDVDEISDVPAMFGDLQTGRLDAVLEVWPSGLEPPQRDLIEAGAVANLGELGVVGKTGWFVPRYLIEENPALGNWEAYADQRIAAQFASEETGDSGRLLGTDPAWEQFDEELIEALDLPFEVFYSGSETATRAELQRRTSASEPVLVYWWTPTAEVARFDLVNVTLPERTPECLESFSQGGLASCDYPEDRLLKLGATDLQGREPEVFRFLSAFSLTTEEQLALIDAIDNGGLSVGEAATEWIRDNEATWRRWLG